MLGNIKGAKGDPKKCFSEQAKNLKYRKDYCYKNFSSNKFQRNLTQEKQTFAKDEQSFEDLFYFLCLFNSLPMV